MSCGRVVALRRGGIAREHRAGDARPNARACKGSGLAAILTKDARPDFAVDVVVPGGFTANARQVTEIAHALVDARKSVDVAGRVVGRLVAQWVEAEAKRFGVKLPAKRRRR